jgi:Domain of unknown function (DUF362)
MKADSEVTRRAFLKAGMLAAAGLAAACTPNPTAEGENPDGSTTEPTAAATTALPLPTATSQPSATQILSSAPTATETLLPSTTPTPQPTATLLPSPTPQPTATQPRLTPTATLAPPTPTPLPTLAPSPSPTARPLVAVPARADLLAHYPQIAQSVVSIVHHPGVWSGSEIQTNVILTMLDAAITQLTGIQDALTAWRVLFDPQEVVGIKVNTISRYTTSPQTAYAVAQRLQDAGIPAEQIVLFDRTDGELRDRGFTLNDGGPGVQCRGAKAWEQPATVAGTTQEIHDVMLSCHALINLPTLKQHGTSGFTSALKNHYGTVSQPGLLHGNDCDPAIPELNALPVIRDKTRLVIGDFVRICPYDWNQMTKEGLIAMSVDPLAHDHIARQILLDRIAADGRSGSYITGRSHYLDTALQQGLGADVGHTEVRRTSLQ